MPVDQQLIDDAAAALSVTVVEALKEGGQKTVLLVERAGERFVMKVIATGSTLPDALKRATREVELLKSIDHPNVVKVASDLMELGETPDGVAWLEEHLDGEDLSDALTERWDWDATKAMALDVARGLSAMHDVKVVHRDLSTNNIRQVTDGRYVVMDPGYARHTEKSQLTGHGQPGTPGFLSPEHLQAYSGAPTAASDVFCVGILMQLALTTELPIPYTGNQGDYAARLAAVTVNDIETARTDLDAPVLEAVRRCLHPQPARRFRNGSRLADALEQL
jgi:eukaryotic-like serine/threonine-protein kinase